MFKGDYAKVVLQIEDSISLEDLERYLIRKEVKFISVEKEDMKFGIEDHLVNQLYYCIKKEDCLK